MVGRSDPEFSLVSEQLLHSGYAFDLYSTSWVDGSGEVFERDIVRHRGAVAVVPLTDDQAHVLLVRQFRTPLNAWLLELPAGLRDKEGESEKCLASWWHHSPEQDIKIIRSLHIKALIRPLIHSQIICIS